MLDIHTFDYIIWLDLILMNLMIDIQQYPCLPS